MAEEGKLAIFSGRAGKWRGGGRGYFIFRGGPGGGVAEEAFRYMGAGRRAAAEGASAGFLYLDRARPPRLTWVALKPTGLPVGSS